jgi:hypothetical protein
LVGLTEARSREQLAWSLQLLLDFDRTLEIRLIPDFPAVPES